MFELRLKTNVDINPMESDLVVQLPFPLEFPGPLTPPPPPPPPPPPGISLSLCGGGLDIFWNHTLKFSLLTDQDTVCSKGTGLPTGGTAQNKSLTKVPKYTLSWYIISLDPS